MTVAPPIRRRGRGRAPIDVIVVGGGPAGAVTAWALARRGLRVTVLERARFPRAKVCGDFVEPRGLRIFEAMGCLEGLHATSPLPITNVAIFVESQARYRGAIPFYGAAHGLPPHGFIVPRHELDTLLLAAARRAGADVREGCAVDGVARDGRTMAVSVRGGSRRSVLRAFVIVGADGTHSAVARSAGLLRDDPRYIAVSQRAYAEGIRAETGEAAFFFDRDLFPGYGWMFPLSSGRANVGVGILAETRARHDVRVPRLFESFLERLRRAHPGCAGLRLSGKPLGGIVKTYGGAGPNYFDGGLLVGDAGSFVDPITGEGITPAAESALIAALVVERAVAEGRADAAFLSRFERDFRAYFDPAMQYLDLCAAAMRNVHMREFWLAAAARGCEEAAADPEFARVAGAGFGGLDVRPLDVLARIWQRLSASAGDTAAGLLGVRGAGAFAGSLVESANWLRAAGEWNAGWWRSFMADPAWHMAWAADVSAKWLRVAAALPGSADPRLSGPAMAPGGAAGAA